jgi:hypothetical protein
MNERIKKLVEEFEYAVLGVQHAHSFDRVRAAKAALGEVITTIENELEDERMRHAACGVVAMSNTRESAAQQRQMLPKYRSASVQDVERAVDREMDYREKLGKVTGAIKGYHLELDQRRHGGVAAQHALMKTEEALGMPWVQGAELAAAAAKEGA